MLARTTADALVSIHDGYLDAVGALDKLYRFHRAMAVACRAVDTLGRSETAILVPDGFAYVNMFLHE